MRDIIINGIIALFATIVGGLIIFYITNNKNEEIYYQYMKNSSYEGEKSTIHFDTLRISNKSSTTSNNLIVNIDYKNKSIIEYQIANEENYSIQKKSSDENKINIVLNSLLPDEEIIINILKNKDYAPKVSIKSDKALAKEEKTKESENTFIKLLSKLFEITAYVILFAVIFYFTAKRRVVKSDGFSQNNSAFLMLHSGLLKEATGTFITAIQNGDHSAYAFSNIATCYALSNEIEKAESFLNGATYIASTPDEMAIVNFNKGLIEAIKGNNADAIKLIAKAESIPSADISKYKKMSVIVKKLFHEN